MANLYEKHNYTNKEIPFLCNTTIREYDMRSGGYSLLKRAGVLAQNEIEFLENCSKYDRNVYLGNKVRNNPKLSEIQINGFIEARKLFFELNNIQEKDVLAIKKDAIFLIKTMPSNLSFDGLEFRLANTYNSYYYLNDMEFYYSTKRNEVDIKGLGKENIPLHKDYFIKDLCKIFSLAEKNNNDFLLKYLKKYRRNYLNKELDYNCYREMNKESMFRLTQTFLDQELLVENIEESKLETDINIMYNYVTYIIPLISLYV